MAMKMLSVHFEAVFLLGPWLLKQVLASDLRTLTWGLYFWKLQPEVAYLIRALIRMASQWGWGEGDSTGPGDREQKIERGDGLPTTFIDCLPLCLAIILRHLGSCLASPNN